MKFDEYKKQIENDKKDADRRYEEKLINDRAKDFVLELLKNGGVRTGFMGVSTDDIRVTNKESEVKRTSVGTDISVVLKNAGGFKDLKHDDKKIGLAIDAIVNGIRSSFNNENIDPDIDVKYSQGRDRFSDLGDSDPSGVTNRKVTVSIGMITPKDLADKAVEIGRKR